MGRLEWMVLVLLWGVGVVSGARRDYFIGIKEIQWDYAPTGINQIQNKTIKEDE